MFDYLIDKMDGRKFDTYEEYEDTVHRIITNAEEELGRVERWACQRDEEILNQLGVEIKEEQNEN